MPPLLQILLVENHACLRMFLARLVAKICPGATIVVVANGAEALVAYEHQPADLIIFDYTCRSLMDCASSARSASKARLFPSSSYPRIQSLPRLSWPPVQTRFCSSRFPFQRSRR